MCHHESRVLPQQSVACRLLAMRRICAFLALQKLSLCASSCGLRSASHMVSRGLRPAHLMPSYFYFVEDCHQARQLLTVDNPERMCIFLQVVPHFLQRHMMWLKDTLRTAPSTPHGELFSLC